MPTQIKIGEDRLTIPYIAEDRDNSQNYGYFDLKTDLSLIDSIPEIKGWQEIAELLHSINSPLSHFQSLGCEKSFSSFANENCSHLTTQLVSYVDIAFTSISLNSLDSNFDHLINAIHEFSKDKILPQFISVEFELTPTFYKSQNVQGWCLSCWIGGFGSSEREARENWSSPVLVLRDFFLTNWVPDFTNVG
jgi:hypothetical protein